jgi:hypothetical protein
MKDGKTPAPNFSHPSSAAAVVFGGHLPLLFRVRLNLDFCD